MDEFVRTHRRNTDPQGSTNGAVYVKPRATSRAMQALDVIISRWPVPVDYETICRLNGWNPDKGYWKRISDLKGNMFGQPCIVEVGMVANRYGIEVGTYQATEFGLALHTELFDA